MKIYTRILTIAILSLVTANIYVFTDSLFTRRAIASLSLQPVFKTSRAYVLPISEPSYKPLLKKHIDPPEISAKAAIVYDIESKKLLYSKNPDAQLPIASLTKIVTALVVRDLLLADEVVVVPKEAVKFDKERQDLYEDEELKVKDLMKIMLVESSNDAAVALASHITKRGTNFIGEMSVKAKSVGMAKSLFFDPTGLDDRSYSTPRDLAKAVSYALDYPDLWKFLLEKNLVVASQDGKIEHNVRNTNQLLGVIPDIVGGKTGYTEVARGCMILIVNVPGSDSKIVSVVLGSEDRFGETKKLIEWTKTSYRWE